MSQEGNEIKIKYTYKKAEDYKQYFVNGVYGGRTPQGEVLCNFYFEHSILPDEEEVVFRNGQPVQENLDLSNIKFQRDFKVSVLMSPQQAKNIGDWLSKLGDGGVKPEEPKQ